MTYSTSCSLWIFVLPKSDLYLMAMLMILSIARGTWYIKENIRCGVLNVSRSITQICFFGIAKEKSEKVMSSLHLHPPSPFIMVVWCVARILGTDVGKTLMNTEMLKFLRACSVTGLYPRYQLGCAFRLPNHYITIASFPNRVCHFLELLQTIVCKFPYAFIKILNDLYIKSNSFCHLRE